METKDYGRGGEQDKQAAHQDLDQLSMFNPQMALFDVARFRTIMREVRQRVRGREAGQEQGKGLGY